MMIKYYILNDSWAVGKTGEKMKKPMGQTKIKTQQRECVGFSENSS
jgi:hypothetical protein